MDNIGLKRKREAKEVVLTVAGSDSGGGAGIQADLRTFAALGVFGTSAIAAVTAQNPENVRSIFPLPAEMVSDQIRAVMEAFPLKAVKTGMLFSSPIMEALAEFLPAFSCPVVVDPVMISTSGKALMREDALLCLREKVLPHASCMTPNIPEAEFLTGEKISSEEDMKKVARKCGEKFHCSVIVKGGHASGNELVPDVFWHEGEFLILRSPRCPVTGREDHGTGCTLSSAFAALLARGLCWNVAAEKAKVFVLASLLGAVRLAPSGLMGMYPPSAEVLAQAGKMVKCEKG